MNMISLLICLLCIIVGTLLFAVNTYDSMKMKDKSVIIQSVIVLFIVFGFVANIIVKLYTYGFVR